MQGSVGHHSGHALGYDEEDNPIYCTGHAVSGQQIVGQSKVRIEGSAIAVVGGFGSSDCACDGQGYVNQGGSSKVRISGVPIIRVGDLVDIHGQGSGTMITGSSKVRSV
jgi:uncharacterized Zn-binding protein involved in type VI secretion